MIRKDEEAAGDTTADQRFEYAAQAASDGTAQGKAAGKKFLYG